MTDARDAIRNYWDVDAHTYDRDAGHHPRSAVEVAAWRAAFLRLLPRPPARVLDAGAGTGFLTLHLARLGFRVTALDIAPSMLTELRRKARAAGADVEIVEGSADAPPAGPFDAVVERHLLWTLPDPEGALATWRKAAPEGRLVLLEALWGEQADAAEKARRQGRALLHRLRGDTHAHHGSYDELMRAALPLAGGPDPERLVAMVESTAWGAARIERLRDVEWAARQRLPRPDQLLGVPPHFAVVAGPGG